MSLLQDELRRVMAEKNLKAKPWSVSAGLSETYVKDILSGKSANPSADGLRKLARAADLPATTFTRDMVEGDSELPAPNVKEALDAPPRPLLSEMQVDVPLYGTAMGGDGDGEFELNGTMIGAVHRLPGIEGRRDVFALHVVGTSMSPWRKANGLIYVEENRAANIGDHVVVELKPAPGSHVRPAVVKQLVAVSGSKIKLAQYSPPKEFEIERKKVHRIYRVIEWDDLLKGNR